MSTIWGDIALHTHARTHACTHPRQSKFIYTAPLKHKSTNSAVSIMLPCFRFSIINFSPCRFRYQQELDCESAAGHRSALSLLLASAGSGRSGLRAAAPRGPTERQAREGSSEQCVYVPTVRPSVMWTPRSHVRSPPHTRAR